MMKHREYPIALKQAAVARVAAGESIAEVARDLKLRSRLLYAWRDKVRTTGLHPGTIDAGLPVLMFSVLPIGRSSMFRSGTFA